MTTKPSPCSVNYSLAENCSLLDSDSMSITFDIPPDVQAGLEGISDLNLRVALYLRLEAQLEAVRRQRHGAQARDVVAAAISKAEADKVAETDPEKSFDEFRRLHQSITERL
ncbi:MAG: hypothetical protein WDN28_20055 [Chthoniobacter sp.]